MLAPYPDPECKVFFLLYLRYPAFLRLKSQLNVGKSIKHTILPLILGVFRVKIDPDRGARLSCFSLLGFGTDVRDVGDLGTLGGSF